jgi:hypothetical protein
LMRFCVVAKPRKVCNAAFENCSTWFVMGPAS